MVAMTAEIDQAAVARLDGLLTTIQRELPRRAANETRRAAIYICQSLRSHTKSAPKRKRKGEYSLEPIRHSYYTRDRDHVLHHWKYHHVPTGKTKIYGAYATRKRSAETHWKWRGLKLGVERAELLDYRHLNRISNAGLAKRSWGWAMKQLYNAASANYIAWKTVRKQRRDPRRAVKGEYRKTQDSAGAWIHNALDYINAALKPGALSKAITSAVSKLEHNIQKHIERAAAA